MRYKRRIKRETTPMSDHNDIQKLLDIQEIMALKGKYCRCVDTKDWESFASILTDDYSVSADGGEHKGKEAAVAFASGSMAGAVSSFYVQNPEINVTGDTATGIWSMHNYLTMEMDGRKFSIRCYGWYYEDYVRTSGGWKLKKGVEKRQRVDVEGDVPEAMAAHMASMPGYTVKRTPA
jgi:ketosteroid isomerase-like protein